MKSKFKSNAAFYWVVAVIAVSMAIFVYLVISDAPRTLPKIKLSYFVDEQEIADSIGKRLMQELSTANHYWIGIEPDKREQLAVVEKLKNLLEQKGKFTYVIADTELALSSDEIVQIGVNETLSLKRDALAFGEKLLEYEKQNIPYLVVTASIYSTSLLVGNPIHKIKEKSKISPMTFSIGYFSADPADEKNLLFRCNTEDHSGVKDWGCFVASKARSVRRKLEKDNPKSWIGLMDLSGEKDYIILLKKK